MLFENESHIVENQEELNVNEPVKTEEIDSEPNDTPQVESLTQEEDTSEISQEEDHEGRKTDLIHADPEEMISGEEGLYQREVTPEFLVEEEAAPAEVFHSETLVEPVDHRDEFSHLTHAEEEAPHEEEAGGTLLLDSSPEDLIALLVKYVESEEVTENIPRVGLLKRSFDAIRAQGEVSDELTEHFREQLAEFNKKRGELQRKQEEEREGNARQKRDLLARLKQIIDADDVKRVQEVREIQEEWRRIGQVPKKEMESMFREFRSLLDNFYQRREMHFELLEYDRKINLQEKDRLIEEAKKLIPTEEEENNADIWRQKMDLFNDIQQQWRSIGHVPREDMERVRDEFRVAIDAFFEKRDTFKVVFEEEKNENARKKEQMLEEMQFFVNFQGNKPQEWNEATQKLKDTQEEWRKMGAANLPLENELWQRYRDISSAFYANKSSFFKQLDRLRNDNLTKKVEICEKAEALNTSSDWEKAAKVLKQLQKEWKEVGPVPEKHSNKLWARFKAACDGFFEQRRIHYHALHEGENYNLSRKRELIDEVKAMITDEEKDPDLAIERVKEIQAEWREVGKVPFKEKEKIWEEFKAEVDNFFHALSGRREKMRDMRLKASIDTIKDPNQRSKHIKAKIARMRKHLQAVQSKVDQYSTNIQYISKGKSGDTLRNQIQQELDKENALIAELKDKIKTLNKMLDIANNPESQEESLSPEQVALFDSIEVEEE